MLEQIPLSRIFMEETAKKHHKTADLSGLEINSAFLSTLEARLQLFFIENDDAAGNICFAGNTNLQAEYRANFSKKDLLRYVLTCINKAEIDLNTDTVPFPADKTAFFGGDTRNVAP